jgi:beta-lactamase regulating signal transducer with metallopeptidase domain
MTYWTNLFSGETWVHLTGTLLHTLWQGALVAAVLGVFLKLTPARRTDLRYGISAVALFVIVLSGFLTWAIVEYDAPVGRRASAPAIALAQQQATEVRQAGGLPDQTNLNLTQAGPVGALSNTTGRPSPSSGLARWTAWAAGVWVIGMALMLCRMIVLVIGAGQVRQKCRLLQDSTVNAMIEQLRRALRITRQIRVAVGEHINVPAVLGVVWPTVLLPASVLTGLPPDHLRAILAHELAHIRRYDYIVNLAQMVIEALLFFNPAVWWVSRQIRIEREAACDALATEVTGDGLEYARALAGIAAGLRMPTPLLETAQSFADQPSTDGLVDRVKRIVVPGHRPRLRIPWYSLAAVLLVSAAILAALWVGAVATVAVAGKILSPKERIDQLAALSQSQPPAEVGVGDRDYPLETHGIAISGTVKTDNGMPLPDHLSISAISKRRSYTAGHSLTGEGGRFSGKVNYGKVYLQAYAEGFAPTFAGPLEAAPGGTIKDIALVLGCGFEGRIKVVDRNGTPIPAAHVKGRYDHPCGGFSGNEWVTDAAGIATIKNCADLPLELDVSADGYQDDHIKASLRPGEDKTWALRPARPTSGILLASATGKPIADADIRLLSVQGFQGTTMGPGQGPTIAKTDSEGRFVLSRLRDDSTYTFLVVADGYRREFLRDVKAGQAGLKILVGPEIYVRGKILGPPEQLEKRGSQPGISFSNPYTISDSGYSGSAWCPVEVRDGAATFELRDLLPGPVHITAGSKHVNLDLDRAMDDLVIDLAAETKTAADKATTRTVVLRLDLPADAPPPKGELTVTQLVARTGTLYQESKRLALLNGEVHLDVQLPNKIGYRTDGLVGYWIKENWGEEVPAGTEPYVITIPAIPAGAIYGRVLEQDGSPAQSALIGVIVVKRSPQMPEGSLGVRVKDSAGGDGDAVSQFMAGPLPLGGTYAIALNRNQTYAISEPVEINEKTPMREIELRFAEGVRISGRVLTPDGKPAPGVAFRFGYETPWSYGFSGAELRTDLDGRFAFEHVNPAAPGRYAITLSGNPSFRPKRIELKPDGKPLAIALERGRTLTGVVVDTATGWPIPGVEVYAMPRDSFKNPEPLGYLNADAKTNERGEFRFSTMGAGEYSLNVRGGQSAPATVGTTTYVMGIPVSKAVPPSPAGYIGTGGQSEPVTLRITPYQGSDLKPRKPERDGP